MRFHCFITDTKKNSIENWAKDQWFSALALRLRDGDLLTSGSLLLLLLA